MSLSFPHWFFVVAVSLSAMVARGQEEAPPSAAAMRADSMSARVRKAAVDAQVTVGSATQRPVLPRLDAAVDVYFGNLHSHTGYSDGRGTPEEAFAYAREVAKLDFLAVTEHNHLLGGKKATPEQRTAAYAGPEASALMPTAQRCIEEGKFVALYGQEFSTMSKGNHMNVFDVPAVIDSANGAFDQLLAWMTAHPDSTGAMPIAMFNHPALGRPGKGIEANEYGRDDFGDDAGWVRQMGPVTQLIELLNGSPTPAQASVPPWRRAPQVMEEFYHMYLRLGFHLAPTGNQDNHKMDWGNSTEVRTGIVAPELTKTALLAAMRARHVYATEDRNLKVIVRVNGHLCGDILPGAAAGGALSIAYQMQDADEPEAAYTIEVFRGTIGGDLPEIVKTIQTVGNTAPAEVRGIEGVGGLGAKEYVYFRITQGNRVAEGDGGAAVDRVWTAAVWGAE